MRKETIIRNSIRCLRCGDEIVSEHRHDFKYCSCGAVAVDGGQTWRRRLGRFEDWEDTSVVEITDVPSPLEAAAARAAAEIKLVDVPNSDIELFEEATRLQKAAEMTDDEAAAIERAVKKDGDE